MIHVASRMPVTRARKGPVTSRVSRGLLCVCVRACRLLTAAVPFGETSKSLVCPFPNQVLDNTLRITRHEMS